jgi:hypothetical protein
MNVEIGTEAAQFPEKEYINGIFVAVWYPRVSKAEAESYPELQNTKTICRAIIATRISQKESERYSLQHKNTFCS